MYGSMSKKRINKYILYTITQKGMKGANQTAKFFPRQKFLQSKDV